MYGRLKYSTSNIGDDIQELAAKNLLPKDSIGIDREFLSEYQGDKVKTLINGWFLHTKNCCWFNWERKAPEKSFPPSPSIDPFYISLHIHPDIYDDIFTPEGIEHLKKHEPIGARDVGTLTKLNQQGIQAYYSGCLTLTLPRTIPVEHREEIAYMVDVPQAVVDYVRSKTNLKIEVVGHGVPLEIYFDHEKRLEYAQSLLDKYQKAKYVVTARLHAALPCLAYGTPVLVLHGKSDSPRFGGLRELFRHDTQQRILSGQCDFDFNDPEPNSDKYIPRRQHLIDKVRLWKDPTNKIYQGRPGYLGAV